VPFDALNCQATDNTVTLLISIELASAFVRRWIRERRFEY
jgi:hypothetical protein